MQNLRRWISPLILAIICQQAIRFVTDISMSNTFWVVPSQHLKEFFISIPLFYLLDWSIRLFLKKNKYDHSNLKEIYKEYLLLTVYLLISITLIVFITHRILDLTDYFRDYVFAAVTVIPILLLYYTLIRNDFIEKKFSNQNLQLEKIKSEKLETDLRFLKAQYHPHFLFNALNTVYFQVDEKNYQAKESLELLSDLLRYQIYNADEPVTLEQEINFLQTYLRFQKLRMDENILVKQHIETENNQLKIYPLLFQPLLENAFKHLDGELQIDIHVTQKNNTITFTAINSITDTEKTNSSKGIGLGNLRKRLSILYPENHTLSTEIKGMFFQAQLIIKTMLYENKMYNN